MRRTLLHLGSSKTMVNTSVYYSIFVAAIISIAILVMVVVIVWAYIIAFMGVRSLPRCPHTDKVIYGCRGHIPDTLDVASLKTGDILIVSYGDARTLFSKAFYDSVWTHPVLVYIDPETKEPYVLEVASYRPPYNGGVIRTPLLTWARINHNTHAVVHVRLNKPAPTEAIDEAFTRIEKADLTVESLKLSWLRFLGKRNMYTVSPDSFFAHESIRVKPVKRRPRSCILADIGDWCYFVPEKHKPKNTGFGGATFEYQITCHEALIYVLQCAGVFSEVYTPCSYFPSAFADRSIPTVNGYEYLPPIQVCIEPIVETCKTAKS